MKDIALDARLLVVAPGEGAPSLAALRRELDGIGVLYTVVDTSSAALSAETLFDGAEHGFYNGVVLATCDAGDGPDAASSAALAAYAAHFHVRQACLSAPADEAHGFGPGMSSGLAGAPLTLRYTPAGAAVFGVYTTTDKLDVVGVKVALGPPLDAGTAPLLVDDAGDAAIAVRTLSDGREMLVVTFDQMPGALHSMQLLYGVVVWVTRGVFVGEKRAYLNAQVDDLFMGTIMSDGTLYRMNGADLQNAARWQTQTQATAIGAGLRLTFAFNGAEVTDKDDLTQAARLIGNQFYYVSHTYDHHRLDWADYGRMTQELTVNDEIMQANTFGPYDRTNLVTPDVSGLTNGAVMRSAADWGIARVVCDVSAANCRPTIPNTGLPNALVPALFMIPRVASHLYANVSTPAQWTAAYRTMVGLDLSVDEIVNRASNALLGYLLTGNIDPSMFHQANLRVYADTHTLLTDLLDSTLQQYASLRVLPVITVPMEEIGRRMQDRGALEGAGVTATIGPGPSITVRAAQAVRVPITGVRAPDAETYGSAVISRVEVAAGGAVTLPLAVQPVDDPVDAGPGVVGATPGPAPVPEATPASPPHTGGGCALAPPPARGPRHDLWAAAGPLLLGVAAIAAAARSRQK